MAYEKYGINFTGPEGGPYQVESIAIGFNRDTSSDGRPSSLVTGSTITLSGPVTPTNNLVDLMINNQNKPIASGKFEMTTADDEGVYRTIEFTNGYITAYSETFSGGSQYQCNYVISAETISVGTAKLDNKWPVKS